jgi:hypothetical protein
LFDPAFTRWCNPHARPLRRRQALANTGFCGGRGDC